MIESSAVVMPQEPNAWRGPLSSTYGEGAFDDVIAAGVLLDVSRLVSGLLGLARPAVGARSERVTRLARELVAALDLEGAWEFEVAARLSQIGWLAVPDATQQAAWRGEPLSEEDWRAVLSHPLVARDLLEDVTRLEGVREMIARQQEPVAVRGEAPRSVRHDRHALGGQILRVCTELDALMQAGLTRTAALDRMRAQPLEFDQMLVTLLAG